jgi:hypothetical protein
MESRAKLYIREKNSLIYPVLYSATCKKNVRVKPLNHSGTSAIRCCSTMLLFDFDFAIERRRQDSNLRRRSLFDFFRKYQIFEVL